MLIAQGAIQPGVAQPTEVTPTPSNPSLWAHCEPDPLAESITAAGASDLGEEEIRFSADQSEVSPSLAVATGDVLVEQGDQRLRAPKVALNRERGLLSAEQADYGAPELAVRSQSAEVDLNQETGVFNQAQYYLSLRNAQGSAEQIKMQRRERRSQLYNVDYSTCARGQEFWQLHAEQLQLDESQGRGIARDISLYIKDIPVLYLPYISFPINEQRQSGWLVPKFGYGSDTGLDLTFPYYWNIAPDQDATLYPRLLGERGLMLGLEYRFLNTRDNGNIRLEYLPDDREFGDHRGAFRVRHKANPANSLYTDLLYQYVSDDNYLEDLDNRLELLSPNYLERHLDVFYSGDSWQALARVQGFQTLDNDLFTPEDEPYDRLPQLRFDGSWRRGVIPQELNYDLHSELVHFDHDNKTTGTRLDVHTALSLPLEWSAGFVKPRLGYRYTAYHLNDTEQDRPSRSAPTLSLDSGIFLERPVQWDWSGPSLQTLEPRLFYLYVPERDHADIPLFDTTEVDRGFSWLFLENRFTGADRLGDANQLTATLTTRVLDSDDGAERLRASIGQIFYFDAPSVGLDEPLPTEADRSPLIAEAALALDGGWSLSGALQWDTEQSRTERSALDLRYRPAEHHLLNISHRFADDELEQLDVSALWSLGSRWRAVGRWNYSLQEKRNLDLLAGLEYSDCCWALRMVARHYRDDPDDEDAKNSLFLELELKGLAGVGSNINSLLQDTIFGYQPLPTYR